jgi:hypothetical protein
LRLALFVRALRPHPVHTPLRRGRDRLIGGSAPGDRYRPELLCEYLIEIALARCARDGICSLREC